MSYFNLEKSNLAKVSFNLHLFLNPNSPTALEGNKYILFLLEGLIISKSFLILLGCFLQC